MDREIRIIELIILILALLCVTDIFMDAYLHHDNPLKTQDSLPAAEFLYSASRYAETRIKNPGYAIGLIYGDCLKGKVNKKTCDQVFNDMVIYAKNQKNLLFAEITVHDLLDSKTYKNIADIYENLCFVEGSE